MLFHYNCKFYITQNHCAEQGRKAMFSMRKKALSLYLNTVTSISLFDTYVCSILMYGCEVWGVHRAPNVEKVHLDYCKTLLGVKRSTSNVMVYYELGRFPLLYERNFRMLKLWTKIHGSENCIIKSCYKELVANSNKCKNWATCIKTILYDLGMNYYWDNQWVLCLDSSFLQLTKQRIYDQAKQELHFTLETSPKCRLYKYIVSNVELQFYLQKCIPVIARKWITRIRLSSHNLCIETGRFYGISRNSRMCIMCDKNVVEDEFHFILQCTNYNDIRKKFIKKYYWTRPSTYKLVQLLSVENTKELCNLGKYLLYAFKCRNNI